MKKFLKSYLWGALGVVGGLLLVHGFSMITLAVLLAYLLFFPIAYWIYKRMGGKSNMNHIQHAKNESAQESVSAVKVDDTNPHTLWKQILGLSIASIISFYFAPLVMNILCSSLLDYRLVFSLTSLDLIWLGVWLQLFHIINILLIFTGILTFLDAWTAGIYKRKEAKSFLNISPMAWGIVMQWLPIIAYPVYLINRNKLKTKESKNALWILTIIFGGVAFLSEFLKPYYIHLAFIAGKIIT